MEVLDIFSANNLNRINRRDRNNIDQDLFMNYESVGSIVQKLLWNWSDDSFTSVQMLAKNFLNKQRRNRRDEEYSIRGYSSFSSVSFSSIFRNDETCSRIIRCTKFQVTSKQFSSSTVSLSQAIFE